MNQDRLKQLVSYDSETGIFTELVKTKRKSSNKLGFTEKRGYVRICIDRKPYLAHRLAWIYVHGDIPAGKHIDHKDGDRSNNKITNLRLATPSENKQNTHRPAKSNKSGFLGVYFCKQHKKYCAQIVSHGERIQLGFYITAELASEAYLAAKRKYHEFYHENKED